MKSSVDEIRLRFDNEVERFANLETGQSATIDAPLVLDLITQAAAATTPRAKNVLDIGCGAGNYTLKLLQLLPDVDATLIDLSRPMLDRAAERVRAACRGKVSTMQADIREVDLGTGQFDIILAAAVLHHLRSDEEWESVLRRLHRALRPGGAIWISDLIEHTSEPIQKMMYSRYGQYLAGLKDNAYRDTVFAYIEQEDTPRPLMEQIDLLRSVGFSGIEILHKNSVFAAFGARKA